MIEYEHKGKIVINSTESSEFYFNIIAENGNIISTSKIYQTEKLLLRGIEIMISILNSDELEIEGITPDEVEIEIDDNSNDTN